jgi:hypothetical protein
MLASGIRDFGSLRHSPEELMRTAKVSVTLGIAIIFVCTQGITAQDRPSQEEVTVHKNVKLIKVNPQADAPEEFKKEYMGFLPLFEEVVRANTADESDDCALTIRVTLEVKEVGSKKIKRGLAQVAAARKNSKNEYVSTLMMYSYVSEGPVSKDEITQFVTQRVLGPAKCQKTT